MAPTRKWRNRVSFEPSASNIGQPHRHRHLHAHEQLKVPPTESRVVQLKKRDQTMALIHSAPLISASPRRRATAANRALIKQNATASLMAAIVREMDSKRAPSRQKHATGCSAQRRVESARIDRESAHFAMVKGRVVFAGSARDSKRLQIDDSELPDKRHSHH